MADAGDTTDLDITIEDGSTNSEQALEEEGSDHESDGQQEIVIDDNERVLTTQSNDLDYGNGQVLESRPYNEERNSHDQELEMESNDDENRENNNAVTTDENVMSQGEGYPPPYIGTEFESYEDAYNYFNSYAKEIGFGIRVKSSWTKRNSKEKRGAVLCCNSEGFKLAKEASTRRKETRTGCQAMIRLRLVESNRWRVDESNLEHNHLVDPQRAQNFKSHKRTDNNGVKRRAEKSIDIEIRTIKLYRTPAIDPLTESSRQREMRKPSDRSKFLNLKKEDTQALNDFFSQLQLTNPNFFYVNDLNDEGFRRHVFWIDPRARAAYDYFGDVVSLDTTCLSNKYEIPLVSFLGVNHHKKCILLGCALLADETQDTYIWLLRTWLSCMRGRPPETIITGKNKALQTAITEVFPRAHHHYYLPSIMHSIVQNLEELRNLEPLRTMLNRILYNIVKVDEFDVAWEEMIQRFSFKDHGWLSTLYEGKERWALAYLKDTFLGGVFASADTLSMFFDGCIHEETSLEEFFESYEPIMQKKYHKEALDDFESKESTPQLKTRCPYELQLSHIYTKELFLDFQVEVELMSSCLTQVHVSGSTITYMVKEIEVEGEENLAGAKSFEVMHDRAGIGVRCSCNCFNLKGYLCRHALCVLNCNNIEEIPVQYILPRWRKDITRMYVPNCGPDCIDTSNPLQRFEHLYRRAMQVAEEGMKSQDHYTVAWQAFKESLNKVRLVADKHS